MPEFSKAPASSPWFAKAARTWPLELVLFSFLVVLHLVPIWVFPYVPTQDGPSHLANAILLKDYGAPQTRYHQFFQRAWEPFPNWSAELLLTALLYLFPPLIAEKVLVSLYIAGFAWSFRYFLGPFGSQALPLAPAGLLFVFNRCFLMGFHNYCFSLILAWVILGYCLRRRQTFGLGNAAVLMVLWWVAYFTHLLGYLLAAGSVAWLLATAPTGRLRKLAWVVLSLAPTAWLTIQWLTLPGVLGLREAGPANHWLARLRTQDWLEQLWGSLASINQGLFEPYEAWGIPLGLLVLLFYQALAAATVSSFEPAGEETKRRPRRLPMVLLGLGMACLYVLVPDFLSVASGFFKARLVLLPPLLWLACLQLPRQVSARRAFAGALYLLIGVNLVLVSRHFQSANRELAEFTAGLSHVGRNRTLFVVQSSSGPEVVNPLEHAADYYCLETGNVNLDNYQAQLKHFPIRFRDGIEKGRGDLANYPNRDLVDLILVWDQPPGIPLEAPGLYREIFRGGRLQLFARKQKNP